MAPSGDQAGPVDGSVAKVSCRGSPPFAGTIQICVATVQPAFRSGPAALEGSKPAEGFASGSRCLVRTV